MKEALGLIETKGLVACIEAADAMCKRRRGECRGRFRRGSGKTHRRSRHLSRHRASA